jgi:hypothetical protein
VFLQIVFYFTDARATDGLNTALKDYVKQFNAVAEKEGVKEKYLYLNFAAWFQEPFQGYGEVQKKTLRAVAKKYDPEGFWQRGLWRGFKLW